jgi:hypothetical protein
MLNCSNIHAYTYELFEHAQDGWDINDAIPPDMAFNGMMYLVGLKRNQETLSAFKRAAENVKEEPKLTRAEILEKARAARSYHNKQKEENAS